MIFYKIFVFVSMLVVAVKSNDNFTPLSCRMLSYDESSVKLFIYNSQSPNGDVYENPGQLNSGEDMVLIVHGWTQNKDDMWVQSVKDNLLQNDPNANIITADYTKYSKMSYMECWCRAGRIATTISNAFIGAKDQVRTRRAHGFSLGGEISGLTGRLLIDAGCKFASITGFDMAGPNFDTRRPMRLPHLDSSCADDVKNVNTDGDEKGLGFWLESPLKLARIVFNGGFNQPGCYEKVQQCASVAPDEQALCLKQAGFCDHMYGFKVAIKLHEGNVYTIALCDGSGSPIEFSKDTGHLPDGVYCAQGDEDANPL